MAPSHHSGTGVPTLLDCWHVRDLQRFRAVLKGGPAAAGLSTGGQGQVSFGSKSPSHSGGHSWSNSVSASLGPASPAEINRKDHFGRTALHLIVSSSEGVSIDFLHALLSHPSCNPNVQDGESGWTALHRALYSGNLIHALTLLRHPHIDLRTKDFENLTAFDVYNSTVAGTNPPPDADVRGDLFLWGSNRNYTLGLGDGNDRALPDLISLSREDFASAESRDAASHQTQPNSSKMAPPGSRFDRIKVKDVQMSRMHTVVLTDERGGGNIWVAGIGSAGRLGRAPSTQSVLTPLADFKETAAALAVGPDHTLIVTDNGSVYSFGYNKFGVLGYTLEEGQGVVASSNPGAGPGAASTTFGAGPSTTSASASKSLDIQISPRKIAGPLKKETVMGVAASKLHSVAFTSDSLFTWGSNTGQLGYDKSATALQVTPRKVTVLTETQSNAIRQVTCTDHATALLLNTYDVLVFHGDMSFRIQFPMGRFNEKMSAGVFRPPQAQPKPSIARLTSSGTTFAALSDYGDLFTFNLDHPSEYARGTSTVTGSSGGSKRTPAPEPQLVWSVRKKFTAVRDVAIGLDGSIILCTSSGHVFVRTRRSAAESKSSSKSGAARAYKFAQIPFLQRVVKVATNESGSFSAIRKAGSIREVRVKGRPLEEDLMRLLPHLKAHSLSGVDPQGYEEKQISTDFTLPVSHDISHSESDETGSEDGDSDAGDSTSQRHIALAMLLAEASKRWDRGEDGRPEAWYGPHNYTPPRGCDMFLCASGKYLPVHRAIIAARIPSLAKVLADPPTKGLGGAPGGVIVRRVNEHAVTLTLPGCSFHTALLLLHYIYTDDLPSVWTSSVSLKIEKHFSAVKMNRNQIHAQLKELARLLQLSALSPVLESPVPRTPTPTLQRDLLSFYGSNVAETSLGSSLLHDVELVLSDREVPAHSSFLKRSPFFAALLQPVWTASRWSQGRLRIDLSHLRWHALDIHLRHVYADSAAEAFRGQDAELTLDQWIDFLTETLAVSDELMLDKLKLSISGLLRARILPNNIAAILTIADTYHATALKEASLLYCAQNLELLLEMGMLEELGHKMIRELGLFVRRKQDERLHLTRHSEHLAELLAKHCDYYESLDIPPPSLNLLASKVGKRGPRSASAQAMLDARTAVGKRASRAKDSRSPLLSPSLPATAGPIGHESAVFDMDEDESDLSIRLDRSPGLAAIAHLSLDSSSAMPNLPRARGSASPWSAQRRQAVNSENRHEAETAGPASVGPATDFRSIMAAEQARTVRQPGGGRGAPTAIHRVLSGQTSDASAPASGAQTPLRSVPMGDLQSPPALSDVSPMAIAAKLSQKDRKKQQIAQARAQAEQQASSMVSDQRSGVGETRSARATPAWKSTAEPGSSSSPLQSRFPGHAQIPGRPSWTSPAQGNEIGENALQNQAAQPNSPSLRPTRLSSTSAMRTGTTVRPPLLGAARQASSSVDGGWPDLVYQGPEGSRANSSQGLPTVSATRDSGFRVPSSESPVRPAAGTRSQSTVGGGGPLSPSGLSFAQIQAQQAAVASSEAETLSSRKKSFMQIQDEERLATEAQRQAEQEKLEFEKWFEEESKRVKRQEGRESKAPQGSAKQTSGRAASGHSSGKPEANAAKGKGRAKKAPTTRGGPEKVGSVSQSTEASGGHSKEATTPTKQDGAATPTKAKRQGQRKGTKGKADGGAPNTAAPSRSTPSQPQQAPIQPAGLSASAAVFQPGG
ncbi:unnamed protein product [Parajaminaea phylloscopi]